MNDFSLFIFAYALGALTVAFWWPIVAFAVATVAKAKEFTQRK
jgi:hypothetical protein